MKAILVTGGCGFIGSNFIRYVFSESNFRGKIINCDRLTYAGNPGNLADIAEKYGSKRYFFEKIDIAEFNSLFQIFKTHNIDTVVNFAAESHVDRSIYGPADFVQTNILGTFNLLEAARKFWGKKKKVRFHHISTDEVFGSLGKSGYFHEGTAYNPRSPYSASKAASDHLVQAYFHTYSLPMTLSNCSNNYGPFQFPEKLIPLIIINAWKGKPLPIYGDGLNIRDWLHVTDHCRALWSILRHSPSGETYAIGGNCEMTNIQVVKKICELMDELHPVRNNLNLRLLKSTISSYGELITPVTDRPGHDRRYAINFQKIKNDLGWEPRISFENGLRQTIQWYLRNKAWIDDIVSGEYRNWIKLNYEARHPILP